jgi:DNA invertase Pin-like site-specific DNA recombinase
LDGVNSLQGQRVGYVRVSTVEQNAGRQLENITVDKVFIDKVSGKDINRPELQALLAYVREADTVVVHSLDRLARSLVDLKSIVEQLIGKGVSVEFVKEKLSFSKDKKDSPMDTLMLNILSSFAEFERAIIRERQHEGIKIAKANGAYRGRKKALAPSQIDGLRELVDSRKGTVAEVAKELGIARTTLYEYLGKKEPRDKQRQIDSEPTAAGEG